MTNFGPVPFIPWGTSRESRGEVKTIHNEKASTFHETLEVGVKDAVTSEYREHSQKSQNSGKPTDVETPRKLVKRTFSRDTHLQHSECREHSQNSRIKQPGMVKATASGKDAEPTAASSDFSKHSQNSLSKGEPKVDPGEAKVAFGDCDGQCLVTVSEF